MNKQRTFVDRKNSSYSFSIVLFAFFSCVVILTPFCSTSAPDLAERVQRIESGLIPYPGIVIEGQTPQKKDLTERMEFYKVPGVSIAVINDLKIEWTKGYGLKEAGGDDPVDPETLFQAASISKPVAALAALHFVEKGLVGLDEDVNRRLLSWKVPDDEFTQDEKVTLRRILSHSAGLTVHGFGGYAQGRDIPTLEQILDGGKPANSAAIRVDIEPGSKFRYSGGGYTVMQQLLIDISGEPFPDIMKETVLDKLGMENSTYEQPLPGSRASQAAKAHRMNGKMIAGKWHAYPEMAAAGLWTTPTDLCRFALEVILSRGGWSNKVLSQEMVQEMLSVQSESYGLGLSLRHEGKDFRFMHGGSNAGFKCALVAYPEREQGVAVMTNGDHGGSLMSEIFCSLSAEYGWKDFKPTVKAVAEIDPEIYDEYAGQYQFASKKKIEISREGNRLFADPIYVNLVGNVKCEIYPESESVFFMTRTDQKIVFTRDKDGKVTGLIQEIRGRKQKAAKLD